MLHKYFCGPLGPPMAALMGSKNICAAFGRTFLIIFLINYEKYALGWHFCAWVHGALAADDVKILCTTHYT